VDSLTRRYGTECGNDIYGYFVSKLFLDVNWRKRFIGRLVHHFVTNVELVTLEEFSQPLIRYGAG
jgi:dGTPase